MGPADPLTQYVGGLRQLASLYINNLNKFAEAEALLNEALGATSPVNGRQGWDEEVASYEELLNLYRKQQKDLQPVYARQLETLTRRSNDFAMAYRAPEYQHFMYAYVESAGHVADFYLRQNNKEAAEAAYGRVFNVVRLSANFLEAKKLDVYLTHLEKYQSLLREHNKAELAAKFDSFVKNGRARQKQMESIQQESNPQ